MAELSHADDAHPTFDSVKLFRLIRLIILSVRTVAGPGGGGLTLPRAAKAPFFQGAH